MRCGGNLPPVTTTKSLLVQLCFELRGVDLEIFADDIRVNLNTKWGYTPTRDDNKVGSLTDPYNLNAKWGYTPTRDDNKVGHMTDPYSYSFSCALNFEEWT
ncbi:hypothetical protein V1477_007144 [Vespula maculifrons]|uniref:Uncharacterized protein n=1 Tax=Vespula maculifrons TaxID=7453 RepID=A0ABD2CHR5_VESMC